MKKFSVLTSTVLPLFVDNIDTDQIIPARFLRSVLRTGYADKLFYFWRFDDRGMRKKNSVFFDERYKSAKILLARENFGIGSSREHAVWAIKDYGFKIVLAISFGDIFLNNALKNSLLTIQLSKKDIETLFCLVEKDPKTEITIDLPNQRILTTQNSNFFFGIDPFWKSSFIHGIDELGYLLSLNGEITEFEKYHKVFIDQSANVKT